MKPFVWGTRNPGERERIIGEQTTFLREHGHKFGLPADISEEDLRKMVEGHVDEIIAVPVAVNGDYQVHVRKFYCEPWNMEMVHLSIKRNDREPIHDWRELQEIKNALVGPECEAVELYPAESRLADTANQYHLWVLSDPEAKFPFGFEGRAVVEDAYDPSKSRAKQRPRAKH